MSEVKDMGLLESLKAQHGAFVQQRDQAQINFQQLQGAIFACEHLIKQHEDKLKAELEAIAKGETPNGEADSESSESCS